MFADKTQLELIGPLTITRLVITTMLTRVGFEKALMFGQQYVIPLF